MTTALPVVPVTPPVRSRDPFLDNARYWVMLLVVVGHFLTHLQDVPGVRAAYTFLYLFHMPVFVLVSGYTARRHTGDARQVRRMVSTLVVPYLLVETGLEVTEALLAGEPVRLHVLEPEWLTWFIAALFIWRLTTPIWLAVRWPVAVAVAVSLLGGMVPVGDVLGIPQVIGFLPFYVAGLYLTKQHFDRLVQPAVRAGAVVSLVVAFVVCQVFSDGWTISWLYFRDGYSEAPLSTGPLEGAAIRALLLAVGLVLAVSALALVPQRRAWFSSAGERTLYPYLLHGFVVLVLVYTGTFDAVARLGLPGVVGAAVVAAALAHVLMTRTVAVAFRPVFEPSLSWLFKRDAQRIER
ncbi:MAG: acyltransferase family protein [Nocardioidaceae bacterium]|nr:acyltransferase family protein [Nocardioidaceae bacterium]